MLLATVITLALAVSALPSFASAAWDGSSVSAALSGSGTESDPYLISGENDLAKIAKDCNAGESYLGKYFRFTASVDLGGKAWTPIGNASATPFSGIVDGAGYSVTGLYTDGTADYGSLFGFTSNAVIRNLTVENPDISSKKYAGAIVGHLYITTDAGASGGLVNCNVTGGKIVGVQAGGLVGRASASGAGNGIFITGCTATGTQVLGADSASDIADGTIKNIFIGGIVGALGHGTVNGCGVSDMTLVTGGTRATSIAVAGGIVGIQGADSGVGDVFNCYASGVKLTVLEGTPTANIGLGGILGRAGHVDFSKIANCIALGITLEDKVSSGKAGSLIGELKKYIDYAGCATDSETAIGTDLQFLELPVKTVAAADFGLIDAAENLGLNNGNSAAVWVSDPASGHPVIDIAALENNTMNITFFDPFATEAPTDTSAEATTAETTVPADVTTEAPADTTEAPTAAPSETTSAPETTAAPAAEKKGCGSSVCAFAVIAAVSCAAVFTGKKH